MELLPMARLFSGSKQSEMARSKTTKALRLALFAGALALELILIAEFWVIPEFGARNTPNGHWEKEFPFSNSPWLPFFGIAFLVLFALGNIGLLVMVLRAIRDLRVRD